jgi:glycosyltransferase involved in cell wall biosynthesis
MNDTEKISIIVPVYNSEKFLIRCIESILLQSHSNFELLLINDGSTDSSENICNEYAAKDSRIRVFHKPNGGVSSARNIGLKNALGQFICFVDSDDFISYDYLESFNISCFPNLDLYVQGYERFSELEQKTISKINSKLQKGKYDNVGDVFKNLVYESIFNFICSKLIRREIVISNQIFFDEKLQVNEDHLFFLNYYKFVNSIYISDLTGYKYSVSKKGTLRFSFIPVSKREYFIKELIKKREVIIQKYKITDTTFLSYLEREYQNLISATFVSIFSPENHSTIRKFNQYKSLFNSDFIDLKNLYVSIWHRIILKVTRHKTYFSFLIVGLISKLYLWSTSLIKGEKKYN